MKERDQYFVQSMLEHPIGNDDSHSRGLEIPSPIFHSTSTENVSFSTRAYHAGMPSWFIVKDVSTAYPKLPDMIQLTPFLSAGLRLKTALSPGSWWRTRWCLNHLMFHLRAQHFFMLVSNVMVSYHSSFFLTFRASFIILHHLPGLQDLFHCSHSKWATSTHSSRI